eukprot:TRINITY_DN6315_c0_g1_i1.p1 TRINITY_DN6315_c0_g1~~TRINITY_DN6315_c0_g1_i1.p1  ORF type:complete len:587 (+),score=85.30 TRINITY_DN6315_c0_g1_i1:260-2020(+)
MEKVATRLSKAVHNIDILTGDSESETSSGYEIKLTELDLLPQVAIDLERIDNLIAQDDGHNTHICLKRDKLLGISMPIILLNILLIIAILVFGNIDCELLGTLNFDLTNTTDIDIALCSIDDLEWYLVFVYLMVFIDGLFLVRFIVHIVIFVPKLFSSKKAKFFNVSPIEYSISMVAWGIVELVIYFIFLEYKLGDIREYVFKVLMFNIILWVSWLICRLFIKVTTDFAQKDYMKKVEALRYKKELLKGLVPNLKSFLKEPEEKVIRKAKRIFSGISKRGKLRKRDVHLDQDEDIEKCWNMITEEKSVTSDYFCLFMFHFWKYNEGLRSERTNRGYIDSIISALYYIFYGIAIIAIFLTMFIENFDFSATFLSFTSLILGFSFMFGTTLRKFFDGIIFIIFDKNYRVGERVKIDDILVVIDEITLRQTIAFTIDGRRMAWMNYNIMDKRIENHTSTTVYKFTVDVKVAFSVTVDQISDLRREVDHYVKSQPDFSTVWYFYINNLSTDEIKISMIFILENATWGMPLKFLTKQTGTFVYVHNLMKQLGMPVTFVRQLNLGLKPQEEVDEAVGINSPKVGQIAELEVR